MTGLDAAALPAPWQARVRSLPAEDGPSGAAWLAALTGHVAEGLDRWTLTVDGPPTAAPQALLLPVRRRDEPLTLAAHRPRRATRTAHVALRTWDGVAAAALVAALPSRGLLLHPRLDPLDDAWWDDPVCEAVGALLGRLRVPAPPSVPTLAAVLPPLLERLPHLPSVPRRVATRTRGLAADLLGSEGTLPRLLHGALDDRALRLDHGEPVAVLPEPLAGHPAWDVWPAVRMRPDDLGTGAALRWSVRHRLALVADAAGLDPEETRAWTLLRAGVEVARTADAGADEAGLSLDLAVMKALDD